VVIGSDSLASDGWGQGYPFGRKLECVGEIAIGFAGNPAQRELIQALDLSKVGKLAAPAARGRLLDAVRAGAKAIGWTGSKAEHLPQCADLCMIVASPDGIWLLDQRFALVPAGQAWAIGCGGTAAKAAMHALRPRVIRGRRSQLATLDQARKLVREGLEAACAVLPGTCGGRIHVRAIRKGGAR
jgi:ATP-dependent protease HslVU (ClpYQ) peptidase subunit